MEYLAPAAFAFAALAYFQIASLSSRVKKMEAYLRGEGYMDQEKESLKEILSKNMGRTVKLELSGDAMDLEIHGKDCRILDIDEVWVQILLLKKEETYLLRIENIGKVKFTDSL